MERNFCLNSKVHITTQITQENKANEAKIITGKCQTVPLVCTILNSDDEF